MGIPSSLSSPAKGCRLGQANDQLPQGLKPQGLPPCARPHSAQAPVRPICTLHVAPSALTKLHNPRPQAPES